MIFERQKMQRGMGVCCLAALLAFLPFAPGLAQAQDFPADATGSMQDPLTPELLSEPPLESGLENPATDPANSASLSVETIAETPSHVPNGPDEAEAGMPAAEEDLAGGVEPFMEIAAAKRFVRDASLTPESLETLFFTAWQHALLKEAKEGFVTAPAESGAVAGQSAGRDPGIREISLGGIAYSSPERWTVWLNGMRVTPDALPAQIMDIKVGRAYIDLKWFDGYSNKIYPIRLRPQERFNLDSRIFLPGTGAL